MLKNPGSCKNTGKRILRKHPVDIKVYFLDNVTMIQTKQMWIPLIGLQWETLFKRCLYPKTCFVLKIKTEKRQG